MLRSKLSFIASGILASAVFAGATHAAVLTLTPVVENYFALNDGALSTPLPIPANNSLPGIYQVDYTLGISLSAADTSATPAATGFGQAGFDVNLGSNLTDDGTNQGYFGNNPAVHTNGGTSGGTQSLFLVNTDGGASTTDLKFIALQMAGGVFAAADPRKTVGQSNQNTTNLGGPAPYDFGTTYVDFDGLKATTLALSASAAGEGFGLKFADGSTQTQTLSASQSLTLGSISFTPGTVPEPASLGLLGLGGLMLARRRKA